MTAPQVNQSLRVPQNPQPATRNPLTSVVEPALAALDAAIVDTTEGFEALRDEWTDLLAASAVNPLFLSWEWLFTWWHHLGAGRRLCLVTLRDAGRLVAVAPLVTGRRFFGPISFPVLEFAGAGPVGSDYVDLIVHRGYEEAALDVVAEFLVRRNTSLRLARMTESALGLALVGRLARRGWSAARLPAEVCPFIDLSASSWEQYLAGLGSSHRYNFKRRLRNLQRSHDVVFECAHTDATRRTALAALVALHRRRWAPRGGSDGLGRPALVRFHEAFSTLAAARGWLRLFLLRLDDVPVAAFYGFRRGPVFSFYQSGFDPAFSRQSIGLVTIGLTIQRACEEGAAEYDFLHGSEDYKFLWTDRTRELRGVEMYPPTPVGAAHRMAAAARRWVGRLRRRGRPRNE